MTTAERAAEIMLMHALRYEMSDAQHDAFGAIVMGACNSDPDLMPALEKLGMIFIQIPDGIE